MIQVRNVLQTSTDELDHGFRGIGVNYVILLCVDRVFKVYVYSLDTYIIEKLMKF